MALGEPVARRASSGQERKRRPWQPTRWGRWRPLQLGGRQPTPGTFLDPMLAQGLVRLAVSVAGGLTTNLILDFIRARLKAKGQGTAVAIEQRESPTGERLLVVRADKV